MRSLLGVVAVALLGMWGCGEENATPQYTGVLEGISVHVPALTGGLIVQMFVDTGQEVTAGDTLAVVDTAELSLQEAQLQAGLEELEAQEDVAQTQLRQATVNVDYVRVKRARVETLYTKQSVPLQNLDDLEHQLEGAQLAQTAARQQMRSLDARRKQLDAQRQLVRKKMADATVVAPTEGLVVTRYFETGEAVPPLQPIVELLHVRTLDLRIYVSEERLPEVRHGQEVLVRVDGLDRALKGRISWVSPRAEFTPKAILTPETRTALVYAVKVTVPNPEGILKDGMPVTVEL